MNKTRPSLADHARTALLLRWIEGELGTLLGALSRTYPNSGPIVKGARTAAQQVRALRRALDEASSRETGEPDLYFRRDDGEPAPVVRLVPRGRT